VWGRIVFMEPKATAMVEIAAEIRAAQADTARETAAAVFDLCMAEECEACGQGIELSIENEKKWPVHHYADGSLSGCRAAAIAKARAEFMEQEHGR